tara:strand:- start:285 stop:413 length:129 start_codon:yes stop_codon:yes gene_type:complete
MADKALVNRDRVLEINYLSTRKKLKSKPFPKRGIPNKKSYPE